MDGANVQRSRTDEHAILPALAPFLHGLIAFGARLLTRGWLSFRGEDR